ncbi:MAG: discoidin domain-containing protein [Crocinitomicaceae bacterium]|nr:discoidin domain-containing protein [Crocinitomicaceae bacterium]
MKRYLLFLILLVQSFYSWSQIGLPIQQSVLPKNSLVVNYDFSKSSSFTRGATTVTNIAGTASGNASIVNAPIFFNSLGIASFNGTNQYVVTPNLRTYFKSLDASVQKSFTMSFWVYPTAASGNLIYELDSQTPDFAWNASNIELVNGYVKYRTWNGSAMGPQVTSSKTVNMNQWYHVAMVYDGTSVKGYLNGVLQGTQTYARVIPANGQFYAIGAGGDQNMGTSAYGNFNLAQFKLYNLPMSDNEILQDYELRKSEFDYTIHSPTTNVNPTYWNVSSAWNPTTGATGASGTFGSRAYVPWLNSSLGWIAQQQNTSQFISLSYDEPVYIKGIVTQGRTIDYSQWVTEAHVETSMTGSDPWTRVLTNQTFNSNTTDDVLSMFPTPVYAKAVRVLPTNWYSYITMRMGMLVKPNNPITDGLVLHLDPSNSKSYGGSGSTWSDLSTSNNHASLTVTPTYNGSNGLVFNGTTHYGSIPSVSGVTDFTNSQKYSIEVWFNPSSGQVNSGEAELLEKWNKNNESRYPFTIRYNEGTSSMSVACYDGTTYKYVTVPGFPVNTWKQLVGVFDFVGKTLTVYRDGVSVGSVSLVGINQVSNTSPIAIATRLTSTGGPQTGIMFKGTIGKIRIYNKSLTASEILQNFNTNKVLYGL